MKSLHIVQTIALALWVGSIAFFAFGVAPVAFHVLPTTHEAGLVVSGSLHVLHTLGLTCGVLFLLAALLSLAARSGVNGQHRAQTTRFSSPNEAPGVYPGADNRDGIDPVAQARVAGGRAAEERSAEGPGTHGRQLLRGRLAAETLVLVMMSLTAYSAFRILPRMERDRAAAGGVVDAVPMSTPARMDFDRLHHISEQVEGGVLLAGLLALGLVAADAGRGASSRPRG